MITNVEHNKKKFFILGNFMNHNEISLTRHKTHIYAIFHFSHTTEDLIVWRNFFPPSFLPYIHFLSFRNKKKTIFWSHHSRRYAKQKSTSSSSKYFPLKRYYWNEKLNFLYSLCLEAEIFRGISFKLLIKSCKNYPRGKSLIDWI